MGHNPTRTRIGGDSIEIDAPHVKDSYAVWSAAAGVTIDTLERLEEN